MSDLERRVVFVAGGAGVIGAATCRAMAAEGARVVVHCRSRIDHARVLAASLPTPAIAVSADLTNPEELAAALAEAVAALGPIDVVVDAAHPGQEVAAVADLTPGILREQFSGALGFQALCAGVVPAMRDGAWGRIVYVSGALMARPAPGFGAYGAAKSAATTLARYLALEEGRHGITVNVVAPGRVVDPTDETPLDVEHAELAARLLERMALPGFPSPDDVARAIVALTAQGAVTGQTVWVTGGEPIAA
ncbi:SDR family NAD(P)-dependent oxidoreductase [Microbacterium excoecariae]|uniref:SDR family NAD(P)-dependent oxidoreductase n=1 Tax=Microbacterium excoecariae TaxID=2715210 RepID=UPI00140AB53D|nr:SDR family oxidoreductase [Microbacterium excoecariae]NHI15991.1 SDR family oxidoreductase [Microbacterium excoecariae]